VHHIHERNILHRDIKCMNILVGKDDTVKLGDFGHAVEIQSATDCRGRSTCGTPETMSPEVVRGKPYGLKTDIWALGCVLYELLALFRPFDGHSVHEMLVKVRERESERARARVPDRLP
jgi:NIMA (never in mitosis gene a)-related kinase